MSRIQSKVSPQDFDLRKRIEGKAMSDIYVMKLGCAFHVIVRLGEFELDLLFVTTLEIRCSSHRMLSDIGY